MKTAGIDVGFDTTKVAIAEDGKIIAKSRGETGAADREKNINDLYNEALGSAGLKPGDVEKVVATGIGKFSVNFATDHIADAVAQAKAARHFSNSATSVVDIGADKSRVVTLDGDAIKEVVLNQKCMAGLGLLLDVMSNRLGYTLDETSKFETGADKGLFVNDGCPVFAEMDSLEALNNGAPKDQVMGAVINTVVYRLNSILHDKVMPDKDATVLIGGVSQNAAVINGLKARSGLNFMIPDDAVFGSAIGAALIAAD